MRASARAPTCAKINQRVGCQWRGGHDLCTGADGRPVLLEHRDLVEVARDNAKVLVEPVRLAAGQAVDLQLLDEAAAGLDRGSDLRLPEVQQVIQRLAFGVIRRQDVARAVAARRRAVTRSLLGDAAAGNQRPFACGAVGRAPPLAILELLPRAGSAEQSFCVSQELRERLRESGMSGESRRWRMRTLVAAASAASRRLKAKPMSAVIGNTITTPKIVLTALVSF